MSFVLLSHASICASVPSLCVQACHVIGAFVNFRYVIEPGWLLRRFVLVVVLKCMYLVLDIVFEVSVYRLLYIIVWVREQHHHFVYI